MTKISASILSEDFSQEAVDSANNADMIHFDIMDGDYVPQTTVGSEVVEELETDLPKDVHLMVQNPEEFIDEYANAGASRISFHIEATSSPEAVIGMIHARGLKAGIALEPATSIADIIDYIEEIDFLLIMCVKAGMGGQKFKGEILEKIRRIRRHYPNLEIEVDGGINEQIGAAVVKAGANVLVSGTYIFSDEAAKNIKKLQDL